MESRTVISLSNSEFPPTVVMDGGTEFECKPGDLSLLHSGHDAWTVGNELIVMIDFQGMIG